ncbi:MAG: mechanosensitive ion channel family protein [Planctomycetota bacterium]
MSFKRLNLAIALCAIAFASSVTAQEIVTIPADKADAPWTINRDHHQIRLRPLKLDVLQVELDAWQNVLKGQVEAIGAAQIAGQTAAEVQGLKDDRNLIVERYNDTLQAFQAKGGDVKAYEDYRDAVLSEKLGTDVKEITEATVAWAKSPTGGLLLVKNVVFFIFTLIAFSILSRVAGRITGRAVGSLKNTSSLLRDFFVNTVRKVVWLIGLVIAVSMLGVNIGPFVAAIGAVGFVVAFALQGTLSNFAAGVMILLYRPYDVGQVVTVGGVTGKVDAMNLVSTTLKTPDNQTVVVPNGSIWGDVITNVTGCDTRRVDMVFGIGYDDDIAKALSVLERIVNSHEKVLKDPAPVIKLNELADSSVNFVVRPWANTPDYWDVFFDVTRTVKEEFDKEGISIPFPQTDVHVHQIEAK